jgi:hypothetical protein
MTSDFTLLLHSYSVQDLVSRIFLSMILSLTKSTQRIFLESLILSQLVRKFPTFHCIKMFINIRQ